jgi:AcrR family transcriptional regulator
MRADAARNLDAVLETGARLLAEDPSTSIAVIAAKAGVDRRTVYRRFTCRDALLDAVLHAKLDAIEEVFENARLDTAPVVVALHRFVEGLIAVIRRYPLDPELMPCDAESRARVHDHHERIATFLRRAMAEGYLRSDLPEGMAWALFKQVMTVFARQFTDLDHGRTADLAVDILLNGLGKG